mmetsp:Transcript_25591/g.52109  ORF Transcript_25591/g.52109 Transcript_25591/m.52109 type:complete len:193 (-) Transcript_25591:133-711(-)
MLLESVEDASWASGVPEKASEALCGEDFSSNETARLLILQTAFPPSSRALAISRRMAVTMFVKAANGFRADKAPISNAAADADPTALQPSMVRDLLRQVKVESHGRSTKVSVGEKDFSTSLVRQVVGYFNRLVHTDAFITVNDDELEARTEVFDILKTWAKAIGSNTERGAIECAAARWELDQALCVGEHLV